MMLLLTLAALAIPSDYPRMATVEAPAGISRIALPPEILSAANPNDGSDFLVVDQFGERVPFAVLHSEPGSSGVLIKRSPTESPNTWQIESLGDQFNMLDVRLSSAPTVADVKVYRGEELVAEQQVYDLGNSMLSAVPVPFGAGPLTVEVVQRGGGDPVGVDIQARLSASGMLDPHLMEVGLDGPYHRTDGDLQWYFTVPDGIPATAIALDIGNETFDRNAETVADGSNTADPIGYEHAQLRAATVDGVRLVQTTVPIDGGGRQILAIEGDDTQALQILGAYLVVPAPQLIVSTEQAGTLTVYGGAEPYTTEVGDLQFAVDDLKVGSHALTLGPVEPAPEFADSIDLSMRFSPGEYVPAHRYDYQHTLTTTGLQRIRLGNAASAHAADDFNDLLVLDPEGLRIYHELIEVEPGPSEELELTQRGRTWEATPSDAARRARDLRIVFAEDQPATLLSIRGLADGPREVFVPRTAAGDPIDIRLMDYVPRELKLWGERDLAIASMSIRPARFDVLTMVPEGGATLVYGGKPAPPAFQFAVAGQDPLFALPAAEVTLSEPETQRAAPKGDRLIVGFGLGVLSLGLLFLTVQSLRRFEDEEPEPA